MSSAALEKDTSFFSVLGLRHFFLNMKEFPEILFYGTMARSSWFAWMGASPLLVILMPLIALSLAGLTLLDMYELAQASNKNVDRWLGVTIATICTFLASVSIGSLVLGKLLGVTFAAGPWIFLSSVALFGINMVVHLGLTLVRLLESPHNSPQQMHFLQRAFSQLNALVTAGFVVACVLGIILFPVAAPLAAIFAIGCTAMTILNIAWRFMPSDYREGIKLVFGIEKSEVEVVTLSREEIRNGSYPYSNGENVRETSYRSGPVFYARLFTAPDYVAQLKSLAPCEQIAFFEKQINQYAERLEQSPSSGTSIDSKKALSLCLQKNIQRMKEKEALLPIPMSRFHSVYQSFWRESEMAELKKAYDYLVRDYTIASAKSEFDLTA